MRRAVIVLLLLAAACGTSEPDGAPGPDLLDDQAPEIAAEVAVTTDGFDPPELTLDATQAFELTNDADTPVRVVGEVGTERLFDTGDLVPGETTVIAFADPGRYTFTIHEVETPPLEVTAQPDA